MRFSKSKKLNALFFAMTCLGLVDLTSCQRSSQLTGADDQALLNLSEKKAKSPPDVCDDNHLLNCKMVWAHDTPVFPYDLASPYRNIYGSTYPLQLAAQSTSSASKSNLRLAITSGVDGLMVDTLGSLDPSRYSYSAIDNLLQTADEVSGVKIALSLDMAAFSQLVVKTPGVVISSLVKNYLLDYCKAALTHASAAKSSGNIIVFIYGTSNMSSSDWKTVKSDLVQAGYSVLFVGDIINSYNGHGGSGLTTDILMNGDSVHSGVIPDFESYDIGYSFISIPRDAPSLTALPYWVSILDYFESKSKPFFGGFWAGYYRGYGVPMPYGAFGDHALATQSYRLNWERQLAADLPWTTISTWSDFVEHTNIQPDSTWNQTRADLTLWYASQFKKTGSPFLTPQLYVTTPQSLYLSQSGAVEAMVINPGPNSLNVNIQLLDYLGNPTALSASSVVNSKSVGYASFNLSVTSAPSGHFYRALAVLSDGQRVVSAPILIFPTAIPTSDHAPPQYYSIPAKNVLLGMPQLSMTGSLQTDQATAVIPNGITYKFVDILHDSRLLKTFDVGSASLTTSNLVMPAGIKTDDRYNPAADYGFYLVRVIDSQNRVGYSDPLYFGP